MFAATMSAQPVANRSRVLQGERWRCFIQHLHEPINLITGVGVAYVIAVSVANRAQGVGDRIAARVEHDDEWNANVFAAQQRLKLFCTRRIDVVFVVFALTRSQISKNESPVKNWMNGRVGEKLVEHATIAAPRSAEGDQDAFVLCGGLALELTQNILGTGPCLGCW